MPTTFWTDAIRMTRRAGWPVLALCLAYPVSAATAPACGPQIVGEGRVIAIADARSVRLEDGREVRLASIEMPGQDGTALARLTIGQSVTLRANETRSDRYGRLLAHVFVSGSETPIQYHLLESGVAAVGGESEGPACRMELLALERAARTAKRGFWAQNRTYFHRAEDPAAIPAGGGRFGIVEGRVLSVRTSGNTIYVNFGRRWSEDFTVTLAKSRERRFIQGGLEPKSLAGRMVRIRGIIEDRGGPWIEALRPEQIEFAGQTTDSRP